MRVVIVGGGVAGLAIGWRLCQADADVTVLERAQPGQGATWAAAGMIAATAELGEAQTPEVDLARRSNAAWPDFAREIEKVSGIAVGYSQSGSLMIATDSEQAEQYAQRARTDADLAMLTGPEARDMEPLLSRTIAGALWAAKEARVDNRALGRALSEAFTRAGGDLRANEAVVRIHTEAGRTIAACTPFAAYRADAFVLAAGAWSGLIEGLPHEAVPPVKPMKGEMLALAPPPGAVLPSCMVWGNEVYLVPRGGRLLIGATLEDVGFETSLTDAAADWLATRAAGLMPALSSWSIVEHWAGLRPASPDGLPLLGLSAVEGLYIASGQYRNGILFAPMVAEIVARMVLGQAIDERAFNPRRFSR